MTRKKVARNNNKITNHHIIPKSRGGLTNDRNLSRIMLKKHIAYHQLFDTMTPYEILEYLVEYFWKSSDGWDGEKFIREFLFEKSQSK